MHGKLNSHQPRLLLSASLDAPTLREVLRQAFSGRPLRIAALVALTFHGGLAELSGFHHSLPFGRVVTFSLVVAKRLAELVLQILHCTLRFDQLAGQLASIPGVALGALPFLLVLLLRVEHHFELCLRKALTSPSFCSLGRVERIRELGDGVVKQWKLGQGRSGVDR